MTCSGCALHCASAGSREETQWCAVFSFSLRLPCPVPPSSSQEALRKKYLHIQNWIEWVGQEAVAALRNMEANFPVTDYSLLELRAVATPQCAKAVLPTMLKEKVTRKEVDAAITAAVHDQYVDWCWCAENPNIHADRGMHLPVP